MANFEKTMQPDRVRHLLDCAEPMQAWLEPLGITDVRKARANLLRLADIGLPLDLLGTICAQFASIAPRLADPDLALNCLEQFLLSARSPLATAALFERDVTSLPGLLLLFNTSRNLSNWLCTDPESYDLIRMTAGRAVARDLLVEELVSEVRCLESDTQVMVALRRFKQRETLRIAYGDIVQQQPIAQTTRQISYVADAIVEGALDFSHRRVETKQGRIHHQALPRPRFAVLALGKLGGLELNYSSDIDLVLLHEPTKRSSTHAAAESQEYAGRVARELIRLLTETTDMGFAYRVDMRLRPEGRHGPLCSSIESALAYYDVRGRTWERQAYVKARAIAGDLDLGRQFLANLEPWIYRRYLSLADIAGIKALKRRIEDRAAKQSEGNVKTGHGGIRDIEFVIQFLQLLNGGALPKVRCGNTLEAIALLEQNGALTRQERSILEENYSFLRKLEHRLQIMFDLQTHQLPAGNQELAKLVRRMDQADVPPKSSLEVFQHDYRQRTELNHKILDHLLHDAFGDDTRTEPEVDLVNDPDPPVEFIEQVMGKYPFADPLEAYTHLMSLAEESIPFLSSRRCRLFLASIAPRLLTTIAATPDPDGTLVSLSRVSESLGGKAALWELFSSNHPTLNLYVTLCAACPYLAGILTSNPGMIDELLDSLLVDHLPDLHDLERSLADLTRGAEDIEPILHSFKHAQHLRVGVRDILGKDDIRETHRALSDIAEACLKEIVQLEQRKLEQKLGCPTIGPVPKRDEPERDRPYPTQGFAEEETPWILSPDREGKPCELVVLALGKLGGREPNYHSDLDLVFLYEAEGITVSRGKNRNGSTTNNHFFSELAQRIMKRANRFGPYGRLYEVDPRLRPTGRSGSLAIPLVEFVRYFQVGTGQFWERQALCKARVIVGSPLATRRAMAAVVEATYNRPWQASDATEIRAMRGKLEQSASPRNLKRAAGGTMDTEFVVQMLQLKYGRHLPLVRQPGTLAALEMLENAGCFPAEDARLLGTSYRFQRNVEAKIRLMDSAGRHEFPEEPQELARLAFLLGYPSGNELATEVEQTCRETRATFQRLVSQAEHEG
jgi:glutamate-ammonia-ligase adenylyltransferase